jgi:hypothetical protein
MTSKKRRVGKTNPVQVSPAQTPPSPTERLLNEARLTTRHLRDSRMKVHCIETFFPICDTFAFRVAFHVLRDAIESLIRMNAIVNQRN